MVISTDIPQKNKYLNKLLHVPSPPNCPLHAYTLRFSVIHFTNKITTSTKTIQITPSTLNYSQIHNPFTLPLDQEPPVTLSTYHTYIKTTFHLQGLLW